MTPTESSEDVPQAAKVAHVLRAKQTREHHCHWPGCEQKVAPAKWGCLPHWRRLPLALRRKIWAAYRPGQEETGSPSAAYIGAAREVREWILAKEAVDRD